MIKTLLAAAIAALLTSASAAAALPMPDAGIQGTDAKPTEDEGSQPTAPEPPAPPLDSMDSTESEKPASEPAERPEQPVLEADAESSAMPTGDEPDAVADVGSDEDIRSRDGSALMWAGLIVAVVVACLLVWALARRTSQRYGWPIILNWWNLLYVVGVLGGMFVGSLSPVVGLGLFAICWAVMLVLNIIKTDLLTGTLATLVQPFAVLTIVFVVMMVTARPKRVSLD